MSASNNPAGRGVWMDPAKEARIVRYLKEGRTYRQISALVRSDHAAIVRVAIRNGLRGVKWSRNKPVERLRIVREGRNYAAEAASLRWGYALGGGWR